MALPQAFEATDNATVSISVGAASANVLVASGDVGRLSVLITNTGTTTTWIRAGNSSVTASMTKDIPIPVGVQVLTFRAPQASGLYIAAIAAAANGSIYFTPGTGI